jgi:hypothetical protein
MYRLDRSDAGCGSVTERTARPDEEGWAKTKKECADLIVYQSAHEPPGDSVYHPTLVGADFFHKKGGVL